nr:Arfaptin homology (AH) domain/BAR domain-containing protein [Ipomoea batatas]
MNLQPQRHLSHYLRTTDREGTTMGRQRRLQCRGGGVVATVGRQRRRWRVSGGGKSAAVEARQHERDAFSYLQDMQDTRDCYEKLLSTAAATTNSAYGKVLLMLGKVQFQLQKLLDNYWSHVSQTITAPSESLLHELNIVEVLERTGWSVKTAVEATQETEKQYHHSPMLWQEKDYVARVTPG